MRQYAKPLSRRRQRSSSGAISPALASRLPAGSPLRVNAWSPVSSWGKRRGRSANLSSVIGLPISASTAAERAAQVSPLPVRASVPVGA
jgi:hypothetical protein